ncbi:hypothetical protein HKX48_001917 [Thoreauomyces humboldtii]|nr:hypothetical protein HKX48_001917 [Thoreauomyces humboldtii]
MALLARRSPVDLFLIYLSVLAFASTLVAGAPVERNSYIDPRSAASPDRRAPLWSSISTALHRRGADGDIANSAPVAVSGSGDAASGRSSDGGDSTNPPAGGGGNEDGGAVAPDSGGNDNQNSKGGGSASEGSTNPPATGGKPLVSGDGTDPTHGEGTADAPTSDEKPTGAAPESHHSGDSGDTGAAATFPSTDQGPEKTTPQEAPAPAVETHNDPELSAPANKASPTQVHPQPENAPTVVAPTAPHDGAESKATATLLAPPSDLTAAPRETTSELAPTAITVHQEGPAHTASTPTSQDSRPSPPSPIGTPIPTAIGSDAPGVSTPNSPVTNPNGNPTTPVFSPTDNTSQQLTLTSPVISPTGDISQQLTPTPPVVSPTGVFSQLTPIGVSPTGDLTSPSPGNGASQTQLPTGSAPSATESPPATPPAGHSASLASVGISPSPPGGGDGDITITITRQPVLPTTLPNGGTAGPVLPPSAPSGLTAQPAANPSAATPASVTAPGLQPFNLPPPVASAQPNLQPTPGFSMPSPEPMLSPPPFEPTAAPNLSPSPVKGHRTVTVFQNPAAVQAQAAGVPIFGLPGMQSPAPIVGSGDGSKSSSINAGIPVAAAGSVLLIILIASVGIFAFRKWKLRPSTNFRARISDTGSDLGGSSPRSALLTRGRSPEIHSEIPVTSRVYVTSSQFDPTAPKPDEVGAYEYGPILNGPIIHEEMCLPEGRV